MIVDYMVVTEPIPERLEEIGWTSHGRHRRRARDALLPAPDRRRSHRDRRRRHGDGVRRPGIAGAPRPTTAGSPRSPPTGSSGSSRSSRACASSTPGAAPSTRRRPFTAVLLRRCARATCTPASASRATGSSRRCSADASSASLVQGVEDRWTALAVVGPRDREGAARAVPLPGRRGPRDGRWSGATGARTQGSRAVGCCDAIGGAPDRTASGSPPEVAVMRGSTQ